MTDKEETIIKRIYQVEHRLITLLIPAECYEQQAILISCAHQLRQLALDIM